MDKQRAEDRALAVKDILNALASQRLETDQVQYLANEATVLLDELPVELQRKSASAPQGPRKV